MGAGHASCSLFDEMPASTLDFVPAVYRAHNTCADRASRNAGRIFTGKCEDSRPFRGDAQFGRLQSEADIQRAALTVRIMSARPSHVESRIKSLPSVTLLPVLAHAPMARAAVRSDFILFICSAGDAGLFSPSARRLVRQGSHVILKFAA